MTDKEDRSNLNKTSSVGLFEEKHVQPGQRSTNAD